MISEDTSSLWTSRELWSRVSRTYHTPGSPARNSFLLFFSPISGDDVGPMTLTIPGFSTLCAILKHDIKVGNQRLEYRRTLASELHENYEDWSRLLVVTFDRAVERWAREDYNGATSFG